MKKLSLYIGKHKFYALIDNDDFELVRNKNWKIRYDHDLFMVYYYGRENNKTKVIYLHRLLMNCPKGMVVDHINGNGLDNRRKNLRICTHQENLRNTKKQKDTTSKYKGVAWITRDQSWMAYITNNYKKYSLGYFKSEKEAARAYDSKAIELFGDFAKINFPARGS